jgi:integrase
MARKFTDIAVRNLKPGITRREIPDPGARGLYVIVQPSGRKGYAVRYRHGGKPRKLTLQAGISLAAARKATAAALYEVEQGRDPGTTRRKEKEAQRLVAADTFLAVAEEYQRREGHKLRSADWCNKVLRRLVFQPLGDRPLADIRRSDIIRLLDKIEEDRGPVMADRTLAIIRKIMNWHATRSDDFRSPIVRGMARTKIKERARERMLTDDELRLVWQAAEAAAAPFGPFVQFLLLTAARRSEAARMTWDEISGTDWTLPAARNKTKVDLIRPLSVAAQEVLAKLPRVVDCKFAFSPNGQRALNSFWLYKAKLDQACGVTGWTLHDLRRTARSLMSRAGVNSDHAERCLGHVIGGVRGTYDRHEYRAEKQLAFEKLATLIGHIVNPQVNIVQMARGASQSAVAQGA